MTTLYEKRGKRYVVWGTAWDGYSDKLRAGQHRLTYCPKDGLRVYHYEVTPMSAPVEAAMLFARQAIEDAMEEAARAAPATATEYTPEQKRLIEQFRADMAAAGAMVPSWWQVSTPRDIAQAGIDALRKAMP